MPRRPDRPTVDGVDFTLAGILVTLWSVFAVTAYVIWRLWGRPTPHRRWMNNLGTTAAPAPDPADTGRHHLPDGLLSMRTYQLGPDRVARARVED